MIESQKELLDNLEKLRETAPLSKDLERLYNILKDNLAEKEDIKSK